MRKKTNYFKEWVGIMEQLHKDYPAENIGWHLALATADYSDVSVMSDKELIFAMEKYQTERSLDMNNLAAPEYVERIRQDGEHLFDKQPDDWEEEEL
jgi:hypothetical protein